MSDESIYLSDSWKGAAFVQQQLCTPTGLGDDVSIVSSTVDSWTGHGGANGEMYHLTLVTKTAGQDGETTRNLVLKTTRANGVDGSKAMGLAREGVFLRSMTEVQKDSDHPLAPLKPLLPTCVWARGDMALGRKALVMEKIDGVQSGYFFGNHSPHNWDMDLAETTKDVPGVTELDICLQTSTLAAILHARHLGDRANLLENEANRNTFRAAQWFAGEGRDTWESTMNMAKMTWSKRWRPTINDTTGVQTFADSDETIQWPPELVALMDESFKKVSWEEFQKSTLVAEGRFTLVHGDFHPGNMLVVKKDKSLALVDWEVVGVGSGPQDLGQYMVSHSHPDERRKNTKAVLDNYMKVFLEYLPEDKFKAHFDGSKEVLSEWVYREFSEGGLARWIWLLPLCATVFPPKKMQYFVNQTAELLKDFPQLYKSVPIPRA